MAICAMSYDIITIKSQYCKIKIPILGLYRRAVNELTKLKFSGVVGPCPYRRVGSRPPTTTPAEPRVHPKAGLGCQP